ncbi:hypothetical protein LXL04_032600 [Taraxacum kok-saghyz]
MASGARAQVNKSHKTRFASKSSRKIEDGDIICFQKLSEARAVDKYRYPDVPSFLEYVKNHQIVHFRSLDRPKEDDFCLELSVSRSYLIFMSKLHTYDDVTKRVAGQISVDDPSKIRLTPHNCYSQQPKPHPIKFRVAEHLLDMLVHYNQVSDILYYEVLDIPLPELQCLKTLKVAFHHSTKEEPVIHNIRLPKQSTVGDVLNEIKTKIFPLTDKIENINDQYWTLRAEEIPEEEKNLGPLDRLIHVYHFTKEAAQNQMQVQNFGEPFFLVIHENETLAAVKVCIQKKLEVTDEEYSKRRDYGAWEQYLGLEHSDTTPKRSFTANQNRHTYEKPVKIYN